MKHIILIENRQFKVYEKVSLKRHQKLPVKGEVYTPPKAYDKIISTELPKSQLLKQHVNYMKFHKGNKVEQALFGAKLAIANHLADNTFGSVIDKANAPKPSYKLRSKFKKDELLESDVCQSQR